MAAAVACLGLPQCISKDLPGRATSLLPSRGAVSLAPFLSYSSINAWAGPGHPAWRRAHSRTPARPGPQSQAQSLGKAKQQQQHGSSVRAGRGGAGPRWVVEGGAARGSRRRGLPAPSSPWARVSRRPHRAPPRPGPATTRGPRSAPRPATRAASRLRKARTKIRNWRFAGARAR